MAEVALGGSSLLGGMLSRSVREDRGSCPTEAKDQVFSSLSPTRERQSAYGKVCGETSNPSRSTDVPTFTGLPMNISA